MNNKSYISQDSIFDLQDKSKRIPSIEKKVGKSIQRKFKLTIPDNNIRHIKSRKTINTISLANSMISHNKSKNENKFKITNNKNHKIAKREDNLYMDITIDRYGKKKISIKSFNEFDNNILSPKKIHYNFKNKENYKSRNYKSMDKINNNMHTFLQDNQIEKNDELCVELPTINKDNNKDYYRKVKQAEEQIKKFTDIGNKYKEEGIKMSNVTGKWVGRKINDNQNDKNILSLQEQHNWVISGFKKSEDNSYKLRRSNCYIGEIKD